MLPHARVDAPLVCQELVMGAAFYNACPNTRRCAAQHENLVGISDSGETVGDDDDRQAAADDHRRRSGAEGADEVGEPWSHRPPDASGVP